MQTGPDILFQLATSLCISHGRDTRKMVLHSASRNMNIFVMKRPRIFMHMCLCGDDTILRNSECRALLDTCSQHEGQWHPLNGTVCTNKLYTCALKGSSLAAGGKADAEWVWAFDMKCLACSAWTVKRPKKAGNQPFCTVREICREHDLAASYITLALLVEKQQCCYASLGVERSVCSHLFLWWDICLTSR